MFNICFVKFSFVWCRQGFRLFSLYKQIGLGQKTLVVKKVKVNVLQVIPLLTSKCSGRFYVQEGSIYDLKRSVLKLCKNNVIKLGFKFQSKKSKVNLNVIVGKRSKGLFSRSFWQKATVPFFFNMLNFVQVSVISENRDAVINPFFGGLRRGFNQGLLRNGIREFKTRLLIPRWYRLQKLKFFRKQLLVLEKTYEFMMVYSHLVRFQQSIMQKENFDFIIQFFIRKRWNLVMVLLFPSNRNEVIKVL